MKKLLLGLLSLWTSTVLSQIETDYFFETQSGYESNIFKSPNTFLEDEELLGREQLHRNSMYQSGSFRMLYVHRWDNQNISLRLNPQGRYYYSDREASYFTLYNRLRYQNQLSRKTRWEVTLRYNYRDRDGEDLDANELRTPLGYGHLEVSTGMQFRAYKQNRSQLTIRYANRDYKDGELNALAYNLFGGNLVFRNVFKTRTGYHSYGVEADYSRRFITRNFFDPEEEDTRRDWSDLRLTGFYRYPITEQWQLKPLFTWRDRVDNDTGRFSYTEWGPGLEVAFDSDTFSLDAAASYASRNYQELTATNSDGDRVGLLEFQYVRFNYRLEYQLAPQLFATSRAYVIARESNRTNENTLIFRGYENYYVGVGLTYRF